MNQEEKQTIVCVFGAKVLVEKMSHNTFYFDKGEECKERFARAAQELEECCKLLMDAIEPERRYEIERVTKSYKLAMMPENDPHVRIRKYMIDDADMKVILRILYRECCNMCTKDKTAVKYCELRRALNNAGEEGRPSAFKMTDCEYS